MSLIEKYVKSTWKSRAFYECGGSRTLLERTEATPQYVVKCSCLGIKETGVKHESNENRNAQRNNKLILHRGNIERDFV